MKNNKAIVRMLGKVYEFNDSKANDIMLTARCKPHLIVWLTLGMLSQTN